LKQHFYENEKIFHTQTFSLSLLLSCFFFSTWFYFLPFFLPLFLFFTLSCFRSLLPTRYPHFSSSSSTSLASLQRSHVTVVLSRSESAPALKQECKAGIQTVIVLRFISVLKTDPTQLTKYLRVIINHRQNGGLLSTG
jgi:hypothetical protein